MDNITAQQSRDARRELGLSQADVTKALDFNRQYLSEFETGFSTRLTNAQLKRLRSYYEEKIEEANENGESITLKFGEISEKSIAKLETFQAKRITYPVDESVSDATFIATLNKISANDKTLALLLTNAIERNGAIFGECELTETTLSQLRECFTLLSANYLMLRTITGWPELGLSASNDSLTDNTVLSLMMNEVKPSFEQAGLLAGKSSDENSGEAKEVEGVAR